MHIKSNHADNALAAAGSAFDQFQEGAQSLARSKDELVKEFESLISAGETLLKSTASVSGDALVQAREQFAAKLSTAQTRFGEMSMAARAKGKEAAKAADSYVHTNPWPVIGTAVGVAFVLGAYSARR